jgi:hypothetical protein
MYLKIQIYQDGGWWDKAYTKPSRCIEDCKLYYNRQPKGVKFPHRVYSVEQGIVLFEMPRPRGS